MSVIPPPRKFGTKKVYSKQPTHFSKASLAKGDRTKDSVANNHTADHYANCHIERTAEGTYTAHDMTDGLELYEHLHASSTGEKILNDGSLDRTITGNYRSQCKGGTTRSGQGPEDNAQHGHQRENVGHDKSHIFAGRFRDHNGHQLEHRAGHHIGGATGLNSSGFTLGKWCQNAEMGCGIGVNKGSTQHVWMRMFGEGSEMPAGTFYLQIMPTGNPGGIATVKIDPQGNITITGTTMTCDITQTITMKAGSEIKLQSPKMTVEVPKTTWKGNITESGIHKDSKGEHC